jgi:hypothetical protein
MYVVVEIFICDVGVGIRIIINGISVFLVLRFAKVAIVSM